MHFLIVYKRSKGHLSRLQSFDTPEGAMRARFAEERAHRNDPDCEIVVIHAASKDALRRSHSRYFALA
jgi:hypothetical protein